MSRIQISTQHTGKTLSPGQRRFNQLTKQIAQLREQLTRWRDDLMPFRASWQQAVFPLRKQLIAASREWLFALDRELAKNYWTSSERRTMKELLCNEAGMLLSAIEDDELKSLYDKHSDTDFDTEKQEQLADFKDFTEAMTGLDLGDEEFDSEEELLQRVQQQMSQEDNPFDDPFHGAFQHQERKKSKKQLAAEERRKAEAATVKQSVRDIYRKLASALHPDKESDPAQRAKKTEMMARVNKAYEANDLLALLEAQLEIEQVDARSITVVTAERLKHYNKVLAEQLDQLRIEQEEMQMGFCVEFALPPGYSCSVKQWPEVLRQQLTSMRMELNGYKSNLKLLATKEATKAWLRNQAKQRRRQAVRFEDDFDDFF